MTDPIDPDTELMNRASEVILSLSRLVEQLRQDRAELRRALYETAYCLTSLDVVPSAMTKKKSQRLLPFKRK